MKRITPDLGILLPIVGYVCCPANDDTMGPIKDCFGCGCFDCNYSSSEQEIKCHYVDDNRNLRDVIRNKENIIAAIIRGPAGYDVRVWSGGSVENGDRV